ncbi:core-binding factor subunit beta isoform X2 [Octopus bimaculoides]|uniref:core-binding factor subunit beta isoform X2 n=1 Tax=Octopus bimaculoides TaxID=37653 RepID=UPI0022E0DE0F|nr:core-binding factor subunit beta isoform X2 [Octopus bimaculoides]
MRPFVGNTLSRELAHSFLTKMPKVVPDQRDKFEHDDLFRKLSHESEIKYTGFRDKPEEERQLRFQTECREGHADIAFVSTGTTFSLSFAAKSWSDKPEDRIATTEFVNFERESGKVEDAILREQTDQYNRRIRGFEERQRQFREQEVRRTEAEVHSHSSDASPSETSGSE